MPEINEITRIIGQPIPDLIQAIEELRALRASVLLGRDAKGYLQQAQRICERASVQIAVYSDQFARARVDLAVAAAETKTATCRVFHPSTP